MILPCCVWNSESSPNQIHKRRSLREQIPKAFPVLIPVSSAYPDSRQGECTLDHELTIGSRQVGKVQLVKEGLYYLVICHAELYGTILYRLVAVTRGRRENIGILGPAEDGWVLKKRIPCKYLDSEDLNFLLIPSHEPMEGKFVPISPEEPFSYLENLKDLYLDRQQSRIGVIVPTENHC